MSLAACRSRKAELISGRLALRAHLHNGYFILEKDGLPVIGIMDADEMEDYLELCDPKVSAQIRQSNRMLAPAARAAAQNEFFSCHDRPV